MLSIPKHLVPFIKIEIKSCSNIDVAIVVVNCMIKLFLKKPVEHQCLFEKGVSSKTFSFEVSEDMKLFEEVNFSIFGFLFLVNTLEGVLNKKFHYHGNDDIKGITIKLLVSALI